MSEDDRFTVGEQPVAAEETKQDRKARIQAEKAAARQAKADAKAVKAADKAAAKEAKAAEKAARKQAKAGAEGEPVEHVPTDPTMAERLERYQTLRANVRRRRAAYVIIIILAVAVLAATVWDIVFNESEFKWYLLPAYVVLFLWGVVLLFSRRRHLQEVAELEAMHRTYLECDNCKAVFQFGELRFHQRKRVGFTCPVCAEESALPGPAAVPVERVLPDANVIETTYACANCNEEIVVGTFGAAPRASTFRACPNCGIAGQVALA